MKKLYLIVFLFTFLSRAEAQLATLLSWNTEFPVENNAAQSLVITMDATKGNQGLLNYTPITDVYVHIGVITNLSTSTTDWRYTKFTWGTTNGAAQCTSAGTNKWSYTITGSLKAFFGVPAGETIQKIAILFRSGNGSKVQRNSDASDMYIPVYTAGQLNVRLNQPPIEPRYIPWVEPVTGSVGSSLFMRASSSNAANLKLYYNGVQVASASAQTSISTTQIINQNCTNTIIAEADDGVTIKRDTLSFYINPTTISSPLPAGVKDGINYISPTQVTLVLYAPGKSSVVAIGDFSNWQQQCAYQMNKASSDPNRFWVTISGLTPGQLYRFQYLIDGTITTTDPYCELVIDPWNDQYISPLTYPNRPAYPTGLATGIVGTFQTNQTPYNWTSTSYVRPDKKNLVITEVLVRDFVDSNRWQTLIDTMNYFKNSGFNCIELMPVNEFDGNSSWGYNPSFYFAPDKAYGTKAKFQEFIDKAHANGIAVVMDVAFNHCTGNSPLAQMWWNSSTNQPAPNNPYLNVTARHPFSVFNDFNHESEATKYYVSRFIRFWMTEYKVDGFRWDLSKGFTQNNNCGGSTSDIACWGNYDQSRVDIWKRYYDTMQAVSPGSYCILEHLGIDAEESVLANYGMMPWGKMTDEYKQNVLGFNSSNDINRAYYLNRSGYAQPNLITYAESHDEERIMYNTLQFGNTSNGSYNVRDTVIAVKRIEAMMPMLLLIPGPKMLWEFGELGYDVSINQCTNGTINSNCRVDPKPTKWNYLQQAFRRRVYDVVASIGRLRKLKPSAFTGATISSGTDLGTTLQKKIVINDPSLKVVYISNFDVFSQNVSVTFPMAGTWYNYLYGGTFNATGGSQGIALQPGEYRVYIDQDIPTGIVTAIDNIIDRGNDFALKLYPNPAEISSQIEYEVPENGNVQINVLDLSGKRLATLFNGNRLKGNYRQMLASNGFNISGLASGTYFVQVKMNNRQKVIGFTK
jgi:hypothetical protein